MSRRNDETIKFTYPGLGYPVGPASKNALTKMIAKKNGDDFAWCPLPLPGQRKRFLTSSEGPFELYTEIKTLDDYLKDPKYINWIKKCNVATNQITDKMKEESVDFIFSYLKFDSWKEPLLVYFGFDFRNETQRRKHIEEDGTIKSLNRYGSGLYYLIESWDGYYTAPFKTSDSASQILNQNYSFHDVFKNDIAKYTTMNPNLSSFVKKELVNKKQTGRKYSYLIAQIQNQNSHRNDISMHQFAEAIELALLPVIQSELLKDKEKGIKEYDKVFAETAKTMGLTVKELSEQKKKVVKDKRDAIAQEKDIEKISKEMTKLPELLLTLNSIIEEAEATHKFFAASVDNRLNLRNIDSRMSRIKDIKRVLIDIRKEPKPSDKISK